VAELKAPPRSRVRRSRGKRRPWGISPFCPRRAKRPKRKKLKAKPRMPRRRMGLRPRSLAAPVGGEEELHEGVARGEEAHLDLA
jgi:hypothetical protein